MPVPCIKVRAAFARSNAPTVTLGRISASPRSGGYCCTHAAGLCSRVSNPRWLSQARPNLSRFVTGNPFCPLVPIHPALVHIGPVHPGLNPVHDHIGMLRFAPFPRLRPTKLHKSPVVLRFVPCST